MAFMTRSRQREEVFKLVFQVESIPEEDRDEHFRNYLYQLTGLEEDKELGKLAKISTEDKERIFARAKTVLTYIDPIDNLLNEKTIGWKTNRMNKVDLAILRLAVYEILYDDDIPESVAINEGVELAKKYSGDDGPAFVNSVLGKFAKEPVTKKLDGKTSMESSNLSNEKTSRKSSNLSHEKSIKKSSKGSQEKK